MKIKRYEKIILALPITSLLFISSACSSDDSTPPPSTYTELLIGKWLVQVMGEYIDGNKILYSLNECEAKNTIEFYKDFNFLSISFEEDHVGNCISEILKGTWSIQDDIITTNNIFEDSSIDNDIIDVKIIKLTATELQFEDIRQFTYKGKMKIFHYYADLIRV